MIERGEWLMQVVGNIAEGNSGCKWTGVYSCRVVTLGERLMQGVIGTAGGSEGR